MNCWDVKDYPWPKFRESAVEVRTWIDNKHIPQNPDVVTDPCNNIIQSLFTKRASYDSTVFSYRNHAAHHERAFSDL